MKQDPGVSATSEPKEYDSNIQSIERGEEFKKRCGEGTANEEGRNSEECSNMESRRGECFRKEGVTSREWC